MSDTAIVREQARHSGTDSHHPLRSSSLPPWTAKAGPFIALGILAIGAVYVAWSLLADLEATPSPGALVYALLALALFIALGFEFVNGFHDTANAVATVIYTHALPAHTAVVWSGFFNFLGVLTSTGA
ncbi:MAG TPA: inorganic phosphate transporter, partial [Candidatus Udaeobacter sp.]|nr:inorganic phosphate transporter [Candidatus Udaeobacter sp.]